MERRAPKIGMEGCRTRGRRRSGLLEIDPQRRPFAAEILLPLLQEAMLDLGMGGSKWVDQFLTGFPITGSVSEEGVYPKKGDPPPPISRSDLLDGAPEGRKIRMSSRTSPFDSGLQKEALVQGSRAEGPFPISKA